MDFYEALASKAQPVDITPGETSYFSQPQAGLDPRVFRNGRLIPDVRNAVYGALINFLSSKFQSPGDWTHAWLAGSGVSHQWAAKRYPADLDCLVGIDFTSFRRSNEKYKGLSDQDIASMINEMFREELWPMTADFLGSFELTFYVNVQSDIRKIKPYAAYSLTNDEWVVSPTIDAVPDNPEWIAKTDRDVKLASEIVARYAMALSQIQSAKNPALRVNAERALKLAIDQAAALYEDIHKGRKYAFSESGEGYRDFYNFRWQAGKESGIIQALGQLKELADMSTQEFSAATYGIELPSVSTLIRRAATFNK